MKKVLFTASTLSHIRNFHLPYLAWFQEQGYTVHVAAGEGGDLPCADKVFPFPLKKSMLAPGNLRAAAALHRLIRAEDYALVSTHTSLAAFFTRLAVGGGKRRPITVNTCHGYLFDGQTPLLKRALLLGAEKLTAGRTDLLFTMNQDDEAIALRHRLSRGSVVPIPGMGVDLSRFPPPAAAERAAARAELNLADGDFALVYAAEFSQRKNQGFLIYALTCLPEHVVLLLAGDGALLPQCRVLTHKLGLENRVRFLGHCADLLPILHAADAAVSASRYEGLPFNLMEAMSAALPVVASDVKGNADLVEPGVTGYLYPYDNQGAFVHAVLGLLRGHPAELGRAGRAAVSRYALPLALETVTRHYERLLSAPPSP